MIFRKCDNCSKDMYSENSLCIGTVRKPEIIHLCKDCVNILIYNGIEGNIQLYKKICKISRDI